MIGKNILVIISLFSFLPLLAQQNQVAVSVDLSQPLSQSRFYTGVVHTQFSLDPWGDSLAVENGKLLLDSCTFFQNQHIMGWGALNPWPDSTVINPQNWNWQSLDRRIQLIRSTGGTAVITLCGCPTWMSDPSWNGSTDWSRLETAPSPSHYHRFASLAREIALRYPDVVYFQVWNELKGFYNATLNRWNYENYTQLYNTVYDSIKAVRPDAKIGGPYVVMNSWSTSAFSHPSNLTGPYGVIDQRSLDVISYWLANKNGADFITIDGSSDNEDNIWITDEFTAAQKFRDVGNWIRNQFAANDTLPIWWAEWYAKTPASAPQNNLNYYNAVMTSALIELVESGAETALLWQPEGDRLGFSFPEGLWTKTDTAGGGQPSPFFHSFKAISDHFSSNVVLHPAASSSADISVMASAEKVLLVNHLPDSVEVIINGASSLVLSGYEVRIADIPESPLPAEYFLGQNFPNPFSASTEIMYSLPSPGMVLLQVSDITGRTIRTLISEEQQAGNYRLTFDAAGLTSGVYFFSLEVKDVFSATRKMMMVKH